MIKSSKLETQLKLTSLTSVSAPSKTVVSNNFNSDNQHVTDSDGIVEETVDINMLEAYAMTSERRDGKHCN